MNRTEIIHSSRSQSAIQGVLPFMCFDDEFKADSLSGFDENCMRLNKRQDPVQQVMKYFSGTIVTSRAEVRPVSEIFSPDLKWKKGSRC